MRMMKKAVVLMMAATLTVSAFTGCVPKETQVQVGPDFNDPGSPELDFTLLNNETIAQFGNVAETPYIFIRSLDISGDEKSKTITVTATAVDGADAEDCEHFASAVFAHMGDAASMQYKGYEESDSAQFGTVYNTYNVKMTVSNEDTEEEIYSIEVPAGEDFGIDTDYQQFENDWEEYMELFVD